MEHVIGDFSKGDRVYHLSLKQFTTKQHMIVTYVSPYIVKCTWITTNGKYQCEDFLPFELEKLTNPIS